MKFYDKNGNTHDSLIRSYLSDIKIKITGSETSLSERFESRRITKDDVDQFQESISEVPCTINNAAGETLFQCDVPLKSIPDLLYKNEMSGAVADLGQIIITLTNDRMIGHIESILGRSSSIIDKTLK